MVKTQSQKQKSTKACFGTKEWSKNSGICKKCVWKSDCGKIRETKE